MMRRGTEAFMTRMVSFWGVSQAGETRVTFGQLQAMASLSRYKILQALGERRGTVTEVATAAGLAKSTTHGHLEILEEAGFARRSEADGRLWVYYDLTPLGRSIVASNPLRLLVMFSIAASCGLAGLGAIVWDRVWGREGEITWGVPPIGVPADPDPLLGGVGVAGLLAILLGVVVALVAWRLTRRALASPSPQFG